jgi:hypothetical protein
MKIILKRFFLVFTLIGSYSVLAGELPEWKEEPPLQLNGHQLRYGSMDYGDNCQGYSNVGVVHLHGSGPNSAANTKGAFEVVSSSINGNLRPLAQWFRSVCARVVAPDSGLKFSLQNNKDDYKRWDTDNSLGGFERRQIIQLMDKMVREQGVTELYLIGFSSGAIMTHNVSQDLINHPGGVNTRVRKAMKGVVIADGISANQVHNFDRSYIGVDSEWWNRWFITDITQIGGAPASNPAPTDPSIACNSTSKLVSPTFTSREHGYYIDGLAEIAGLAGNKKWDIPTLIISSLMDKWISPCLKTHFAQSMSGRGVNTGTPFGHSIRIKYVNSKHDGSVWSIGFPLIQRALLDAHETP